MEHLLPEIAAGVASYLSPQDLSACCAVSLHWREVFGTNQLFFSHTTSLSLRCTLYTLRSEGGRSVVMKLFVFLFIVLCGLNSARAGVDRGKAIELMKECKEKTKAKEDIMDIFDKHNFPSSAEGKCMMHCVLETKGLMKGEKTDTKAFTDYFEKIYATEPAQLEKAAKAIAACSVKMNEWKGLDKCEIASRLFQCGHDNHIQLS